MENTFLGVTPIEKARQRKAHVLWEKENWQAAAHADAEGFLARMRTTLFYDKKLLDETRQMVEDMKR